MDHYPGSKNLILLSWLKKSPQHLEEFLLALSMLEGVSFSQHSLSADVKALLDQATADVVHLKGVESADEKIGRSTFLPAKTDH